MSMCTKFSFTFQVIFIVSHPSRSVVRTNQAVAIGKTRKALVATRNVFGKYCLFSVSLYTLNCSYPWFFIQRPIPLCLPNDQCFFGVHENRSGLQEFFLAGKKNFLLLVHVAIRELVLSRSQRYWHFLIISGPLYCYAKMKIATHCGSE